MFKKLERHKNACKIKMKFILLTVLAMPSILLAEDDIQLVQNYSEGYNIFTSNIYQELLKSNSGSFIMSPLSADIIFSLVSSGAKGVTVEELTSALHLPESIDDVYKVFVKLENSLHSYLFSVLDVADKVYIKDDLQISEQFKNVSANVFGTEVQNINFGTPNEAAAEINRWIENKTEEHIKNPIDPNVFDEHTSCVLVSAVIFKASWFHEFERNETEKRSFKLNYKESVEVNMMRRTGRYAYHESSELNATFLEIWYKTDISMYFVLPNDVEGLSALESKVADALAAPDTEYEIVDVMVPKFKIKTDIDFIPVLKKMGVKTAFEDDADFSGIVTNKARMKISHVVQNASIEIDENGTIAGVSSGTNVPFEYPEPARPQTKVFHADHPFMFYIRFKRLGINIFVGRYTGP